MDQVQQTASSLLKLDASVGDETRGEASSEGMVDKTSKKLIEDRSEWKLVPAITCGRELTAAGKTYKRIFVGAGARVLFYPTLLYNVIRNKLQTEFRWWDQIEPFLLLGAVPFPGDVLRLKTIGVKAVVTLNEPYETLVPTAMYEKQGISHLVIPTRDYLFAPSLSDIQRAVDFIHSHVQQGETAYVHCKAGRGRSTTVVLCYLVEHRGMTPMDALQYVRSKRPRVLLATSQWQAVQEYSKQVFLGPMQCMAMGRPFLKEQELLHTQNDSVTALDSTTSRVEDNGEFGIAESLEELPVLISNVDLAGYSGIQDAGLIGNGLWEDLGVVYRVRFMAARSVVNAVGVARASVAWARFSCLFLGCQAEGSGVLGAHTHMAVGKFSSSDVIAHSKAMDLPALISEQMSLSRLNFPLCRSGMVNG